MTAPQQAPMPDGMLPMLATAAPLPADDERWSFEMKWDGVRALVGVTDDGVRITSRRGNDVSARYPELHALAGKVGGGALLDGEIVAVDANGRPSFEVLQQRMNVASLDVAIRLAARVPVVVMLFDVLWLDGRLLVDLPYTQRRALLDGLALASPHWQTPPAHTGDGAAVHDAATSLGLEGVVAKRLDSRYEPGRRSPMWRKTKVDRNQELVVGGWLPGAGRLETHLGSLLVGYYDDQHRLRYAGRVGSGIDESTRRQLESLVTTHARADTPFVDLPRLKAARFVEPVLVVEVRFHEWTQAGILRHPRYAGLRDDIDPDDVAREPA